MFAIRPKERSLLLIGLILLCLPLSLISRYHSVYSLKLSLQVPQHFCILYSLWWSFSGPFTIVWRSLIARWNSRCSKLIKLVDDAVVFLIYYIEWKRGWHLTWKFFRSFGVNFNSNCLSKLRIKTTISLLFAGYMIFHNSSLPGLQLKFYFPIFMRWTWAWKIFHLILSILIIITYLFRKRSIWLLMNQC